MTLVCWTATQGRIAGWARIRKGGRLWGLVALGVLALGWGGLGSVGATGCVFDESGLRAPDPGDGGQGGVCGDGRLGAEEACDDGNLDTGDGCDAACQVEPGWACVGAPSVCVESCGNGQVDAGEACDDENLNTGDGCDAACQVEPGWACVGAPSVCAESCGNGQVDAGEACDDENLDTGDGCDAVCRVEAGWGCAGVPSICTTICGDGLVVGPEGCDDGDADPGDGCDAVCQVEDGWTCAGAPSTCQPVCGDGVMVGGEVCDDQNTAAGDGCDAACQQEAGWVCSGAPSGCEPVCGDGLVVGFEACDDGNLASGDGCDAACQVEPFAACDGEPSVCACVVFVDRTAVAGAQDGSGWADAMTTVQAGVDEASSRVATWGACEVWVARGTYSIWDGSVDDALELRSQVAVYGGFLGGEARRQDRDPAANDTVLDGANPGNTGQRVWHVVTATDVTGGSLDGFHVERGESYGEGGGGLRVVRGSVRVQGCWFRDNLANLGGAIYAQNATLDLVGLHVEAPSHATVTGGALGLYHTETTMQQSDIVGADADGSGGAAHVEGGSLQLVDMTIHGCAAAGVGGGIDATGGAEVTLTGVTLEQCTAASGGGIHQNDGALSLEWSRVTGCHATGTGGGIDAFSVATSLSQSVLDQNHADGQGGGVYVSSGHIDWAGGVAAGNDGSGGGGLAVLSATADLRNVTVFGNVAHQSGWGNALYGVSATVTGANLIVWHNGSQQTRMDASTLTLRYSVVQGGASGPGNLTGDPLLADPSNGDFHLSAGSSAIDAADGDQCPPVDLDGASRYDDPATPNTGVGAVSWCDIGAFEAQ